MKKSKVDVIIPCYNYAHFIDECLEAVTSQVFEDFQVTLIDNASTDDTQQHAERWAEKDSRIHYVRNEKNLGFHGNVEKAIELTDSDLVVILPVDDFWGPLFLESTVTALDKHPEAVMAYTDWSISSNEKNKHYQRVHIPHSESGLVNDQDLLVMHNWIPLSFGVFRRKEFEKASGINSRLSMLGDYELWLKMAAEGPFYFCSEMQGYLRQHAENWSRELGESGQSAYEHIHVADTIFGDRDRWSLHTRYLAKARQAQYLSGETMISVAQKMCDSSDPMYAYELQKCKKEFLCAAAEAALRNTGPNAKGAEGLYGSISESVKLLEEIVKDYPDFSQALELKTEFETAELNTVYRKWIGMHGLQDIDGQLFAERMMLQWKQQPIFHCVLFLMPGEEDLLANTLDSLGSQLYPNWRLSVIAETPAPDALWDELDLLTWVEFKNEENPYDLVNELVAGSDGNWVSFIEPGAQYSPQAFVQIGDYVNLHTEWNLIYTDEDLVDAKGLRSDPKFKPDFNLDLLRSKAYVGNACFIKKDALTALGGYSAYPQAENHDLVFKAYDEFGKLCIGHISDVLYHSPADSGRYLDESILQQVVKHHLDRSTIPANVGQGYFPQSVRVEYLHPTEPLVSIVIPSKDKFEYIEKCLASLFARTDYKDFEVIVVDNNSSDPDTLSLYNYYEVNHKDAFRVIEYNETFNFSAMCNLGASESYGDYVLFLNNDTEIVQASWLSRMVLHGQRPDVGVVGARLVYPETGILQHAGTVLGLKGMSGHPFSGELSLNDPGFMGRAQCDQNYSAVTGACMLVSREDYQSVGGMDSTDFPVYNGDIDLCLKVQELGKTVVWTPFSTVVHFEGASQKRDDLEAMVQNDKLTKSEFKKMVKKWLPQLVLDPAYNPNLSLDSTKVFPDVHLPRNWDVNFYDRIRVLGFPISGGSGDYRVIQPFEALSFAGLQQCEYYRHKESDLRTLSVLEVGRMQPDTIVVQAAVDNMQMGLVKNIDEHLPGIFKVCTMDDLITDIPEKSSAFKMHKRYFRDVRVRLRKVLSHCDRLIVSTQPLADAYADLVDDIRVIPNRLTKETWTSLESERAVGDKPRVGWVGAAQHYGDLEQIFDVVKQTADEFDWVFMGMCPDEIKPFVKESHDFVSIQEYPTKMASLNLDLAVAPLEVNEFNKSKSNLRLLEYGVLGWPVVCTDIYPYQSHDAPVTRVPNETDAWLDAIRAHVGDLSAAAAAGDKLREWVLRYFILEDHLAEWQDAFSKEDISQPMAEAG